MKLLPFYLILALIAAATAYAADTIVFKNGDVLSGQVISKDDTSIRFSSTSLGELTLDRSTVSEIISPPAEAAKAAAQAAPATPADKPEPEITQAEPVEKAAKAEKAKSQWSGQAGLAIAMRETVDNNVSGTTKEDKFQTYRLYGHINWQGERNSLKWNWTYRYSADETRTRDDFLNLTQRYNRDFNQGYYSEAKTVYQSDFKRNIDNEFLQTAELGKRWFDQPKLKFSTSAGGGYHVYERNAPTQSASVSEPKFIFDESLELKLINTLTLFQTYTHLGDMDRYNLLFRAGLENTLIRDLFIRLEYRVNKDTDTDYDGRDFSDKAFLTSLLYKF